MEDGQTNKNKSKDYVVNCRRSHQVNALEVIRVETGHSADSAKSHLRRDDGKVAMGMA